MSDADITAERIHRAAEARGRADKAATAARHEVLRFLPDAVLRDIVDMARFDPDDDPNAWVAEAIIRERRAS